MRLPLFPLHTVLFPHLPLPLRIFEERYRAMVGDLLVDGSPYAGRFVVSLITEGSEVGDAPKVQPHPQAVGTVAEIRQAERMTDGRWVLLAVAGARVAIGAVDRRGPYPIAEVTELPEVVGEAPPEGLGGLMASVQKALDGYLDSVKRFAVAASSTRQQMDDVLTPLRLPEDPLAASYAVCGVIQIELVRKQRLLELPDAVSRLAVVRGLLLREARLLGESALPPIVAGNLHYNPN